MNKQLETSRLILRPWHENDAVALYRYAKDPSVGLAAGWQPHTSITESLKIIQTVFNAPEIYAMILKETEEAIGCIGIVPADEIHSTAIQKGDVEIGYWIGKPYWGQGLTPEAVNCLLKHCFTNLNVQTVWGSHYEENQQSFRVMQKCGFKYHHTEAEKITPLGDVRTEHYLRLNIKEWEKSNK